MQWQLLHVKQLPRAEFRVACLMVQVPLPLRWQLLLEMATSRTATAAPSAWTTWRAAGPSLAVATSSGEPTVGQITWHPRWQSSRQLSGRLAPWMRVSAWLDLRRPKVVSTGPQTHLQATAALLLPHSAPHILLCCRLDLLMPPPSPPPAPLLHLSAWQA